jgi:uncharacterized membrane protein YcaP (DUF421 family)
MNIKTTSSGIEKDIIIDGKIMEENLTSADLDIKWLTSELSKQKIKDCSEVFYAGVDNTKNLYISKKTLLIKKLKGNMALSDALYGFIKEKSFK